MIIKKGDNFILTTGKYSDYSILEAYVANKDFDTKKVLIEYLNEFPKQKKEYEFRVDLFMKWLEIKNYAELLKLIEWHVENHGSVILD